jgi:hypothetical protein
MEVPATSSDEAITDLVGVDITHGDAAPAHFYACLTVHGRRLLITLVVTEGRPVARDGYSVVPRPAGPCGVGRSAAGDGERGR